MHNRLVVSFFWIKSEMLIFFSLGLRNLLISVELELVVAMLKIITEYYRKFQRRIEKNNKVISFLVAHVLRPSGTKEMKSRHLYLTLLVCTLRYISWKEF